MHKIHPELFDLSMSKSAQPLLAAVKKHIADNVEPIAEEFEALNHNKEDPWAYHPRQLELLEGAKQKAREAGLWNFFLPDADTGEGLSNLRRHSGAKRTVVKALAQRRNTFGIRDDRTTGCFL